jgi:DNA-binding winged helix-turn-helix (wHTH) protein
MMTARHTSTDKVLGLDAGADDYLVKPVDLNELVARIRALLRRGNTTSPILEWGSLQFDPSSRELSYAGQPLNLRPKELAIMELLLRQKHRVSSRQMILDHLWSLEDCPDDNTIKAHIRGIRRILETVEASNLIETLYGKGYRLNPAYLESSSLSSVAPATPSAQVDSEVIAEAWQQVQHLTWQRLQALNESVQTLKRQPYNQMVCQQAEILAHQLAGTLGSYGFEAGSRVAKQLEQYLQQHHQNSSSSGFDHLDCSAPLDINTRSLDAAQLDLWMLALYQVICPALTPVLKHVVASTSVQPSTKTKPARQLVSP